MQGSCIRCKKEIGFLEKWKCKDGVFCYDCIKDLPKKIRYNLQMYSVDQITNMIEHPEQYSEKELIPKVIKFINSKVIFDPVNQAFYMETAGFFHSKMIPYSSVLSYEYKEDGKTKGTYGKILGAAALGGIFFGGAGAIVGALTQKKGEKHHVKSMEIEIKYQQEEQQEVFRMKVLNPLLSPGPVYSDDGLYKALLEDAEEVMKILDKIIEDNHPEILEKEQNIGAQSFSAADEIRKFKELMDEGIITEAEFEMKKKELLGINDNPVS